MENEKKTTGMEPENEFEKKNPEQEEEKKNNPPAEVKGEQKPEEKPADEKKKSYNLDEVTEYTELKSQYDELQNNYSTLQQEKAALDEEVASLREFKLAAEREKKQNMIKSFYMLTDEDKKDVVEHIDTYSLDEIEAKLSVICVRNKVDFNLNSSQEQEQDSPSGLFSLDVPGENDNAPDWVKAVMQTAKND